LYSVPATRLLSLHTPEQDLTEALHEFVERDNKESMKEAVARALAETQARGWVGQEWACLCVVGESGGWCDG
jgi:cobalamin biosynthesis protein CobD/CbiB